MFFLNASWILKETQNHICTLWIHMGTKNKHWILRDQKLKTNLKKKHTHIYIPGISPGEFFICKMWVIIIIITPHNFTCRDGIN